MQRKRQAKNGEEWPRNGWVMKCGEMEKLSNEMLGNGKAQTCKAKEQHRMAKEK